MRSLGVSRVTVRAGLTRLVERGLLERRQGSGTFLVRPPAGGKLRAGLERLETYTIHAERMGLELDSRDLRIEAVGASPEEAEALELHKGSTLVQVSRVLLVDGESAAWMLDVVPEEILPIHKVRKRLRPEAMLLDLLVAEGLSIGFSKLLIEAVMVAPGDPVGDALEPGGPSAALSLTETMYLDNGRPVQWSRNVFLPGNLNLHVVRELSEVRALS